ncbi:MAG: hypothetical protein ACI4KG_09870, partial [Oscillospiraceae bacterium]
MSNNEYITITQIMYKCINIKMEIRKKFDSLYSSGEISLDELKQYIIDNYNYYFPSKNQAKITAKKWSTFKTSTDNSYIASITYYIHVVKRFRSYIFEDQNVYRYLEDQYYKKFPFNRAYYNCIMDSFYSEDELRLIFESYTEALSIENNASNYLSFMNDS